MHSAKASERTCGACVNPPLCSWSGEPQWGQRHSPGDLGGGWGQLQLPSLRGMDVEGAEGGPWCAALEILS